MRVRTGMIATAALWLAVAASAPSARPSAASAADDRSGSRGSDSSGSGSGGSFSGHSALDATLAAVLQSAGFTGRIESTLERRLGRPIDRHARRPRPAALVRQDHRPAQRQHLRRLPLADQRLRRHAVDRHRHPEQQRRRPGPRRPAQPAAHADGDQHRVLSQLDVERALQRAARATRSTTPRASTSRRPRGTDAVPAGDPHRLPPARRPGPHPADRAGRGGRLHRRPDDRSATSPFDDGLGGARAAARPATGSRNEPIRQAVLDRLNATPELPGALRRRSSRACGRAGRSLSRCSGRRSPSSSSR